MCSIVGMAFQKGNRINDSEPIRAILDGLLLEGQWRGHEATGVCIVNQREFVVAKRDVSATAFVDLPDYRQALADHLCFGADQRGKLPPICVIGHNRQPTQGHKSNQANNHPITYGKVVGVHNGMIGNDHKLFASFGSEMLPRIAQVDSEIIFALVDHFSNKLETHEGQVTRAIQKASRYLTGSYACALSHLRHPYALFLFRHTSPCEVLHFKDLGLIVWASTTEIMRKAIEKFNLGLYDEIKMENDSGLAIDLERNLMNKFRLDEDSKPAAFYT